MPKEDFDLDKFIGDAEIESGEEETIRKFFSRDKNKGFVLRQSDYDKSMNTAKADLQTKVQALAEKQETLDRLVTQNIEYKGTTEKSVEEFKAKTEKEIKVLRAKAVKAAELAGMDLEEIEADELLTPKAPKAPVIDLAELDKKYLTPDALNRMATGHINLTLELDDVKDAYEELNGKKLTRPQKDELLKEYSKDIAAANKAGEATPALMRTADRLYEFSAKREDIDKGKLKTLLEEAEARGRAKAIQEAGDNGLPTPRRAGVGSVIFNKTRKDGEAPTEGRGAKLALEALEKMRAGAPA